MNPALLLFVSLAALSMSGCQKDGPDNRPPEQIWKETCTTCHGSQGQGLTMKLGRDINMRSAAWQGQISDAQIAKTIAAGKSGLKRMPAFGGQLSDEQIEGLVKLIRNLK